MRNQLLETDGEAAPKSARLWRKERSKSPRSRAASRVEPAAPPAEPPTPSRLTVRFERDVTGLWIASVAGLRGTTSHGRTLAEARQRIEEALTSRSAAFAQVEYTDAVSLEKATLEALRRTRQLQARAAEANARADLAVSETAATLMADEGLSARDAAYLLGVPAKTLQRPTDDRA